MKVRVYGLFLGVLFLINANGQVVQLDEAIRIGLQKNYDILVQKETSALAANDNRFAFGAFLPQINANGSYNRNSLDSRNQTFGNDTIRSVETVRSGAKSTTINGNVQLLWTIFDGTRMFATRKRIEELAVLGEINVRNQMMNTTANIISNYFNIIRQKQQLRAVQELMKVSEERVKLAEKNFQVGTGGKPELLQAKVDLNSQRTAILSQETLIQQLKDQLNGSLGMELPDVYDVSDSIPINLSITMEEIINGIENSNQTVLAAKRILISQRLSFVRIVLHDHLLSILHPPILSISRKMN